MGSFAEMFTFIAGLIMGTGSTITIKVVYELNATGRDGHEKPFEKPLFTTWIMFIAMTFAVPLHFLWQWMSPRIAAWMSCRGSLCCGKDLDDGFDDAYRTPAMGVSNTAKPLLNAANEGINTSPPKGEEDGHKTIPTAIYFKLMIPAVFDLIGTIFAKFGLMYCTVSVYQLVRCTVMIFTAILKVTVLKHRLKSWMWAGVAINTLAMVMVAAPSFLAPATETEDSRDPRLGILFLLISCFIQGSQYVFEERMMSVDGAPPLIVVGMEGFWGTLLMILVIHPWAYITGIEDIYDSWIMLCNSASIRWMLAGFWVTVMLYNVFAVFVTFLLSSLWHAILDNFRPVTVWAVDLLLFYAVFNQSGPIGEPWTKWSYLQLAGMLTLFFGTAVYNKSVRVCCLNYNAGESIFDEEDDEFDPSKTPNSMVGQLLYRTPGRNADDLMMKSPSLTKSPLLVASVRQHTKNGRGLAHMETSPYPRFRKNGGNNFRPIARGPAGLRQGALCSGGREQNPDCFARATTPGGSNYSTSWKITDEIVLQKTPELVVVGAGGSGGERVRSESENLPPAPLQKSTAKHSSKNNRQ